MRNNPEEQEALLGKLQGKARKCVKDCVGEALKSYLVMVDNITKSGTSTEAGGKPVLSQDALLPRSAGS